MLEKPEQELRTQRYSDYQGTKNAWPLTTLIRRYFVPSQPMADWTEDSFYHAVSSPAAQDEIRRQLSRIEKQVPAH